MEINAKDARSRLSMLLKRVGEGEEIVILLRGKKVARLVPAEGRGKRLPSMKDFRAKIKIKGDTLSTVVARERGEARY